jgi:peptidyl serine alpha-galactosyltransferase
MFGYNLAAAHLGLRHTITHSFMVSDMWAGMEGWSLVTNVDAKDVCHNFPHSEYPHVIHYCQRYSIGKWFIGKYRLRRDFISCEAPLLKVPPSDVALRYTYSIMPGNNERKDLKEKGVKQQSFMVCAMIDALNAAAKFYKDQHCNGQGATTITKSKVANYSYSYTFFTDMSLPEDKLALPS